MTYTIRSENGTEITEWDLFTPACGDFPECHTEPPTCPCPRMCGRSITVGPRHDPHGVTCERDEGHSGPHRGPIFEDQQYEWTGGGMCAGDPLPIRGGRL
jgi:hypothetical protein